jgi:ABC-type multidrug transport system fused ATPase/permease subunit
MKIVLSALDPKVKIRLYFIICMAFLSIALESLSIVSIFPLIKILVNPEYFNTKFFFIFQKNLNEKDIYKFAISFVLFLFLLKNTLLFIISRFQAKFVSYASANLSSFFFTSYIKLSYIDFITTNSAQYIRNITDNVDYFFSTYFRSIMLIIIEIPIILILVSVLFYVEPMGSFVFGLTALFFGLFFYNINKKRLTIFGNDLNKNYTKRLSYIHKSFGLFKEIQISNNENFYSNTFFKILKSIAFISYKMDAIVILPKLFLELAGITIILILIYFNLSQGNTLTDFLPTVSLFALSGFRLMPSANRLLSSFHKLKFSTPFINMLNEAIHKFKKKENNPTIDKDTKLDFSKVITIKDLTFKYNNSNSNVLRDFNLSINKGDFIIILGPSGSGKSTFINILLGLINPSSGHIYSDNVDVFDNLNKWRKKISHVPQDVYLSDDTILSNVALGVKEEDIDKNKVRKALKSAQLEDFIENLPDNILANAGEKAVRMSGGQRQRMAIARALYRSPEILLLDEATSSLDRETEKKIIIDIKNNLKNETIIMVTHRLAITHLADKVYSIKDGKLEVYENLK